ncbi:MAG: prepilin-type N-terminal cleavage/methylation domain-containing protein [Gemmatimonadaceae bacterium]
MSPTTLPPPAVGPRHVRPWHSCSRHTRSPGPRSRRSGFTIIELVIVVVIIGLLAGIVMPRLQHSRGRAFTATLHSDLRNLAMAEESYYSRNGVYTLDFAQLSMSASPGVTLSVSAADERGWGATAAHPSAHMSMCAVYYGAPATQPAPATTEGEIACQ